jgi:hypothetical protein
LTIAIGVARLDLLITYAVHTSARLRAGSPTPEWSEVP